MEVSTSVFDPVQLSLEECAFMLEAVDKPPIVAMARVPAGVNPRAVRPLLERFAELQALQDHGEGEWIGTPAIKSAITAYLTQATRWAEDKRRGRPRFPSMHTYDSRGRAHYQAAGSDSGQVRTYFAPDGSRVPFAVGLIPSSTVQWTPDWAPEGAATINTPKTLKIDSANNRIECGVPNCGHTESYKPESRSSFNAARGRMSRHLRSTTDRTDDHRELHTLEFS